jgi:hypothetical protein
MSEQSVGVRPLVRELAVEIPDKECEHRRPWLYAGSFLVRFATSQKLAASSKGAVTRPGK